MCNVSNIYVIRVTRHWYSAPNSTTSMRGPDGNLMQFDSKSDAAAALAAAEDGLYELAYNESGRPTLRIGHRNY